MTISTQTPTPTDAGKTSCQVVIPDYSVLRQQNITKINNYYNSLLSSYTKNYSDYSIQSASSNINDKTNANTIIMPKVKDTNTQIINLSQSMINNVNQDNDLINEQKNDLTNKMEEIDSIITNINLLSDKDTEMTVLSGAKQDSLSSTTSNKDEMQFKTYIYIGVCILLVLLVIGLIIYLVYSNYTNKSSNNNTSTNIYKNIATNNISNTNKTNTKPITKTNTKSN
jgi:hypothetical protein